jgi:hypothetical protein
MKDLDGAGSDQIDVQNPLAHIQEIHRTKCLGDKHGLIENRASTQHSLRAAELPAQWTDWSG